MASEVRITGLRETVRNLERLGVSVQDLREAFLDISRDVVSEARGLVRVLTGRLRETIREAQTKNKAVVRAGTPTGVPYAGVVNYVRPGDQFLTRPANTDTEGKVRRIEANLEDLIRRYNLR